MSVFFFLRIRRPPRSTQSRSSAASDVYKRQIPQLEAEKAENERKISQLQHKKQQLENRITYYEKGDRRKRAHHLITRGAAIESIAPLTKVLTETEFYAFAEKALAVLEIKGLLMEAVNEHNQAEQKEGC